MEMGINSEDGERALRCAGTDLLSGRNEEALLLTLIHSKNSGCVKIQCSKHLTKVGNGDSLDMAEDSLCAGRFAEAACSSISGRFAIS